MKATSAKAIFNELLANKQKNASPPQISKTELSHFKQLLEKSRAEIGNMTIFSLFSKKTWIYRGVFCALAVLFFYLALAIHPKSISWSASLLFGSLISTKSIIITACVALGSIAALIGVTLCAAKELTRFKVNKAYRELWKIHEERKLKKRIPWFTDCKEKLHLKSVLHHLYRDVCDKIDAAGKETTALIYAIQKGDKMTPEYKERLIEQSLDELDGRLLVYLNGFRSSWIE